jgi:hypothetical protein
MIELQNDQIIWLNNFNQRLTKIGQFLAKEMAEIDRQLTLRVADVNDPIFDFEISVEVAYYRHENDPGYLDDGDNILTVREFLGVFKARDEFDDWPGRKGYFGVTNHCWLFRDLYDHDYCEGQVGLPIEDILRIGEIWVEIKPRYQYFYELAPN